MTSWLIPCLNLNTRLFRKPADSTLRHMSVRIFFSTQFTRHLDRSGYIRFRQWRFYAEAGLAKQAVHVHIYTSTLKVEYEDTDLAFYIVAWHEDNKHITEVSHARLVETSYRSPQLTLWTLGPDEWLLFKRLPNYAPRHKRQSVDVIQLSLRQGGVRFRPLNCTDFAHGMKGFTHKYRQ